MAQYVEYLLETRMKELSTGSFLEPETKHFSGENLNSVAKSAYAYAMRLGWRGGTRDIWDARLLDIKTRGLVREIMKDGAPYINENTGEPLPEEILNSYSK